MSPYEQVKVFSSTCRLDKLLRSPVRVTTYIGVCGVCSIEWETKSYKFCRPAVPALKIRVIIFNGITGTMQVAMDNCHTKVQGATYP